jgi:hypothetical protein
MVNENKKRATLTQIHTPNIIITINKPDVMNNSASATAVEESSALGVTLGPVILTSTFIITPSPPICFRKT